MGLPVEIRFIFETLGFATLDACFPPQIWDGWATAHIVYIAIVYIAICAVGPVGPVCCLQALLLLLLLF